MTRRSPRPTEDGRRLDSYLATCGKASRRKAKDLVAEGTVTVNGAVVLDSSFRVDPAKDKVQVDGATVRPVKRRTYLLLYKPPGYVSTCDDEKGRATILDLLPKGKRLFPVGRLDYNAEGLLLVTDDGDLAFHFTHPRFGVPRTYRVKIQGHPSPEELAQLVRGVRREGVLLKATSAKIERKLETNAWLEIVLTEGRYHEVKELLAGIGYGVVKLIRTAYGPLTLGDLSRGQWRALSPSEEKKIAKLLHGPAAKK